MANEQNLTRAGQGRPKIPGKVALNTRIKAETKDGLAKLGKIGPMIDQIYEEWLAFKASQ